ncbi:hypothetical protein MPH_10183 [Macrophomina phaseolina MS6]|uniref:Uncharacterized protein n=1 Tax=Macrophomina phaseolina (strain MS6) TaxID=1126212 RepID=K2RR57_MACPH|nr:hypothetical protein MPH_10183 [Macrophomina phaseolina MS6]
MAGHFEFSDYPMLGNPRYPEIKAGDHIPGDTVRRYLEDFAANFGLTGRVRCGERVVEAEDLGAEGWTLSVESTGGEGRNKKHQSRIHACMLVLATGLTTTPKLPSLPERSKFDSPVFHVRDFGKHAASTTPLPSSNSPHNIIILSANKSAADAAHHYATHGAHVHWVIRPDGHGPCWLGPPTLSPLKLKAEGLLKTRLITFLHPCIWGSADGFGWVRHILHKTHVGRKIVDGFQRRVMQAAVEKAAGFEKHPGTERLRPWHDIFWIATRRGLLNYTGPDVYELVRQGRIDVHLADIEALDGKEVRLGDGQVLKHVEAVVCATGWEYRPPVKFMRNGVDISAELSLPRLPGEMSEEDKALVARADAEILEAMPRLKDQPAPARLPRRRNEPYEPVDPAAKTTEGPYALYRFMVPPSRIHTRTLAFSGVVRTPVTAMIAEIQALWLSAFFSNQLPHLEPATHSAFAAPTHRLSTPAIEKGSVDVDNPAEQARAEISARVKYESILHARYGLWRYPHGFGAVVPDLFFDSVPLIDLMVSELGLRSWRKANLVKEVFSSYGPHDYVGMLAEWSENCERGITMTETEIRERRRILTIVGLILFLWVATMVWIMGWIWTKW